uniref:Uncharacterized protein n=1 Tax=Rhizophora mucronata TaxID=61149 RepID=A0A2P2Q9S8_RHIMU
MSNPCPKTYKTHQPHPVISCSHLLGLIICKQKRLSQLRVEVGLCTQKSSKPTPPLLLALASSLNCHFFPIFWSFQESTRNPIKSLSRRKEGSRRRKCAN